jgi:hypothetical protein
VSERDRFPTAISLSRESKCGRLDPLAATLPEEPQTAPYALYSHYAKTFEAWRLTGLKPPPGFRGEDVIG